MFQLQTELYSYVRGLTTLSYIYILTKEVDYLCSSVSLTVVAVVAMDICGFHVVSWWVFF